MVFKEGDEVELWSRLHDYWLRGVVTGLDQEANCDTPAIKIKFDPTSEAWLLPKDVDLLRHWVQWDSRVDPEAPVAAFLCVLRSLYFASDAESSTAGLKLNMRVGRRALQSMWIAAIEEESGNVSRQEEREHISELVRQSFEELGIPATLSQDVDSESADLCSWLHRSLLRCQPPGPDAAAMLEAELVRQPPRTTQRLVTRWMRLDTFGTGLIAKDALVEALRGECSPTLSRCVAERMATSMLHCVDSSGFGRTSYCEFALRCLGIECSQVVLYWYDLSGDWAKYLSPVLLGSWEGGVWHTGISAFDREYYFGDGICWGRPAATLWGRPTKAQRLGLTTKKFEEFREHVFLHMNSKFDGSTYNVLRNNCNHFADQAAIFLLGQGIPDEVKLQSQRFMGSPVVRMIGALVNPAFARALETQAHEDDNAKRPRGTSVGGA